MASAGGKISFAHEEVQPGATLLFRNFSTVFAKKIDPQRNLLFLGAFTSGFGCSCSEKEQKRGVFCKTLPGATYSQETGCTLFALLNSIRGQGATTSSGSVHRLAAFLGKRQS
ncbi:hypothetical protein [Pseudomonas sp. MWU13-2517]|uniref:hypothetical protein n=1 Tax=Pseudomonas sp. MWU13-2517 TaxID=2929055 RepID=UPI00200C6345|nr:hypothetical protein [Pseudomonas sp. MWU13-2517]